MRIFSKSTTNFDASASTEPTQRHHEVQDQWLLMQGTEVQNKCAGDEAVRTDRTCILRNQRDTLWISWNIGCKLVFVRFCQNVKSTFWHGFARIQIWDRASIFTENPRRTHSSQGARAAFVSFGTTSPSCVAESHKRVIVPHSTRLCLSASASRPDFLSFKPRQEDEERAKAS